MTNGFAAYLPHFATNRRGRDLTRELKPLGPAEAQVQEPDHLAEAEERGRREAREAARIEFERRRAEDLADFELRLAEERQRWTEETADRLADRISDGLREIEASLAAGVAGALAPLLDTLVRQRAVDELSTTVSLLLRSDRHIDLTISGPDDLLARLRARLDAYSHSIQFAAGGEADVRVTFNDTVIETRIAAWTERLAAAAAEEQHG